MSDELAILAALNIIQVIHACENKSKRWVQWAFAVNQYINLDERDCKQVKREDALAVIMSSAIWRRS